MDIKHLEQEVDQLKKKIESLTPRSITDVLKAIEEKTKTLGKNNWEYFDSYIVALEEDMSRNDEAARGLLSRLEAGGTDDELVEFLAKKWKRELKDKWTRYKTSTQDNRRFYLRKGVDLRDYRGGRPKKSIKNEVEQALEG